MTECTSDSEVMKHQKGVPSYLNQAKWCMPFDPERRWATASFFCWKSCSFTTSSDKRWRLAEKSVC